MQQTDRVFFSVLDDLKGRGNYVLHRNNGDNDV